MADDRLTEKKIAVVGIGGVGGYLAGMLGRVCFGLTLVARGARREALQKNGLVLHSDYHGEIRVTPKKVTPLEELDVQDYIFICVKNYSLEEVCRDLSHAVAEDTVIIPVMNGVDPADRVRAQLGKGIVLDALIYIVAFAGADASVTQQGKFANLQLGAKQMNAKHLAALKEVDALLTAADIDHKISDDIEREIWRKYILNCAFNVTTACYDAPIGQIRSMPERAKEYEDLVNEAFQVALAKGVHVQRTHMDMIIRRFYREYADDASSSLQRDIHAGKQSEVETFSGYLVREAERLGVDAPVSKQMYERLRKRR